MTGLSEPNFDLAGNHHVHVVGSVTIFENHIAGANLTLQAPAFANSWGPILIGSSMRATS
jgi:hypothetical protein